MTVQIREKLLILIIVPLSVLLLVFGGVTRLSLDTHAAAADAQRSSRALQSAQYLLTTLIDAETGMRGYVLTGDRRFADPYRLASSSFKRRIAAFTDVSNDGSSVENDSRLVVRRALSSFSLIDRYVYLVDEGEGRRARAEIASGAGKQYMDRFRAAVATYERVEHGRDDATSAALAGAWADMYALLVTGMLVAVATTVFMYFTVSRNILVRLRGLQEIANAVAAGRMPPATVNGNDEITRVERSFHDMGVLLGKREQALVRAGSLQRAIIDGTDHAIVTTDTDGIITSFNGGAARMLGYTPEDVVGRCTPLKFHLPEELAARAAAVALEVGRPVHGGFDVLVAKVERDLVDRREWTFVRAEGTHVRVSVTVTPLRDDAGTTFGYLAVSEDVTQPKAAERAVVQSELEQRDYARQLRSLHLIANTVATAQKDPINRSLRLGLEQLRLGCAFVGVVDEERGELLIDNSVAAGEGAAQPLVPIGSRIALSQTFLDEASVDSDVYAVESSTAMRERSPGVAAYGGSEALIAAPIYVSGLLYGMLGFLGTERRDAAFSSANREFVRVTADLVGAAIEREQQRVQLDGLAFFDALTGLPNRVLLLDRLTQTVLAAKRHAETFGLLYLDLDGFKAVNDTYGHSAGDEVLKAASRRFEKLMRTSDTVARFGGDEFVILAPKLASALDAGDLASRVVKSMHRPIVVGGVPHALSVSVGVSVYPYDGREAGSLVDGADRALYAAKSKGKNTFTFASDSALRGPEPANPRRLAESVM